MNLWIRTQSKKSLVKVSNICIDNKGDGVIIVSYSDELDVKKYVLLGKYETYKRALEVLDEIQRKINSMLYLKPKGMFKLKTIESAKHYFENLNNREFIIVDDNFEMKPINTNNIVYEMPEE